MFMRPSRLGRTPYFAQFEENGSLLGHPLVGVKMSFHALEIPSGEQESEANTDPFAHPTRVALNRPERQMSARMYMPLL